MAKPPEVYVHEADLKGEAPVAIRDGLDRCELAIDFTWPPDAIVAGLQCLFREAVDSNRWTRNDTREHGETAERQSEAAPHQESGLR
ncbi:hypothetical protein [Streptomyces scabiei]|uniref:hypothetical protein n=1 Tax=Streptomyces scabiei TaxID=1930 RepID=UPI0029A2DE1C|nr:hypothetical protein [Streptomyces scabiei]MDX3197856.1 hypothetical protein [Streptomyces scabiei]MDX3217691.1 hypothetical protein [Streptomyces scabiei]